MPFELHHDLARDGIEIGRFALCRVLLIDDMTYPWFVLVPERIGISDTIDLTREDHAELWAESRLFGLGIMAAFEGEKLNVAALGNVTPQLHVHHIVRFKSDPAWPAPIWGQHPLKPYTEVQLAKVREKVRDAQIAGLEF